MAKVKLNVRWGDKKAGDEVVLNGEVLEFAIRRGFAVEIPEPEPEMMDKMIEPKRRKK